MSSIIARSIDTVNHVGKARPGVLLIAASNDASWTGLDNFAVAAEPEPDGGRGAGAGRRRGGASPQA